MSAITQVQICNLALGHIGQKKIQALDENSRQAQAVDNIYISALEEALRSFNWPFAKTKRALVLISAYTPLRFSYGYAYPSNCVIVRKVYNEGTIDENIGEKFEEVFDPDGNRKVIETDCEYAYGEYTYNLTDTTLYDASFVTAFSHRLASDLAVALNGDKDMAKEQIMIFNSMVSDAKRIADSEKRKPRNETSTYETARD